MGTQGCSEYTEYVLVAKFGVGVYDLPASTIETFLDIMEIERKVQEKREKQPTNSKQWQTRG